MTVIWPELQATEAKASFRQPGGASRWHTDLVHEKQPAGVTHLHNDTVPKLGGDTLWSSGYGAYEKLSPEFRKMIDGKKAVYRSAHPYLDRDDLSAGPKYVEREHPLIRTHPATGWKALWVNRASKSFRSIDFPFQHKLIRYETRCKSSSFQARSNTRNMFPMWHY